MQRILFVLCLAISLSWFLRPSEEHQSFKLKRARQHRQPASMKPVIPAKLDWLQESQEIMSVVGCLKNLTCGEKPSDRAKEFNRIKSLMTDLESQAVRQDESRFYEFDTILTQVFSLGYGPLKVQAIRIMAYLPPAQHRLNYLLSSLMQNRSDVLVFQAAIPELERYKDTPQSASVHRFIQLHLKNGGHYSSQLLAENALQFLSKSHLSEYEKVLSQLPPSSAAARSLRAAIIEFQAMNGS